MSVGRRYHRTPDRPIGRAEKRASKMCRQSVTVFIAALPFMIVGSFMLVFIFPPISTEPLVGFAAARAWLDFSNTYQPQLLPVQHEHGADDPFHLGGRRIQPCPPEVLDPVSRVCCR